jgi:hypothetical protein
MLNTGIYYEIPFGNILSSVRPTPLVTEEAALEKKNLYMATKEL